MGLVRHIDCAPPRAASHRGEPPSAGSPGDSHRRLGPVRDDRDRQILDHLGLAYSLAHRYGGSGLDQEDVRQVAVIGLIKAVDRFDPEHGAPFASFAVPTILGEIKHHFRDVGWAIKVPRPVRELQRRAIATRRRLEQQLGRSPSAAAIAAELGESTSAVAEAMEIGSCFRPASLDVLDRAERHTDDASEPAEAACERADAQAMLTRLPPREREIFVLRYHAGLTQREIGDRVGLSQMHVSRLLRAGLSDLRAAA